MEAAEYAELDEDEARFLSRLNLPSTSSCSPNSSSSSLSYASSIPEKSESTGETGGILFLIAVDGSCTRSRVLLYF
jgi:hypothetical protein